MRAGAELRGGGGGRAAGVPGVTAVPRSPQEPELDRGLCVAVSHLADPGQEAAPRGECRPPRRPPAPARPLTPLCAPQIIEKRRRDRINNSLSELRRLVPSAFEKQVGRRLRRALLAAPRLSARSSRPSLLRDRPSWRKPRSCR